MNWLAWAEGLLLLGLTAHAIKTNITFNALKSRISRLEEINDRRVE